MTNAEHIENAVQLIASRSEFGVADLQPVVRYCLRFKLTPDDVQQYVALKKARKEWSGEVVGHNYYIIPKPSNL